MNQTVDAIILLRPSKTLQDAAQEALEVLGAGGDPLAPQDEYYLGILNTPPSPSGYVRVRCYPAYAQALEYIQQGETVDLVQVLWPGIVETETDCGRFADA